MTRRLVVAAAAALALAGCGSTSQGDGGAASTTAAASPVDAWAEKVCSGVADEFTELAKQPNIDPGDPAAAKAAMGEFLGKLDGAMRTIKAAFADAGAPPVANGDKLLADFGTRIDEITTTIGQARTELDATSTTDPAAFQQGFLKVAQQLQAVGTKQSPLEGLNGDADLAQALRSTPSCAAIGGGAGATPTS
ncbi:hypothetical protein [Actinokineospora bangkokensis]|uniref:Small secreted protein n=1 Tax=Actinokineospora bangkokensis TaxID=1193682 RepID=A0A1Q9LCH2_9PSEU|nr:hypothetical protein [Actinokineospora bangkokensis]OLR89728.1 hypothetical protein BJP25_01465 [Actinokineospora bangkokensis]